MKFFLLLVFTSFTAALYAQEEINVSGSWYGIGYVEMSGDHNSYLSELKLTQKGKKVTGEFNYFYRSDEVKTTITGKFDPESRTLILNAAPILNFQAKNSSGADCPMEGEFVLVVAKMETTLSGEFKPTSEYRLTCPAISIKFKKAVPIPPPPPPPPPFPKEITVIKPRPKYTPIKKREKDKDTLQGTTQDVVVKSTPVPAPEVKKEPTPEEKAEKNLKRRSFEAPPVIEVEADSLVVRLYDNGEIDNDTISLFYNRKLFAYQKMLDVNPLTFTLPLDTTVNEISMYAENLGKIPPNTALAVIYAGEQRYELFLTSTFIKNAAVRFKRKVKHYDPKNIN